MRICSSTRRRQADERNTRRKLRKLRLYSLGDASAGGGLTSELQNLPQHNLNTAGAGQHDHDTLETKRYPWMEGEYDANVIFDRLATGGWTNNQIRGRYCWTTMMLINDSTRLVLRACDGLLLDGAAACPAEEQVEADTARRHRSNRLSIGQWR